jgi:predicted enzyme related to lactoylglutathione lyase
MRIGEVCLLTSDVARLAAFYGRLLGIAGAGGEGGHRTLIAEEPMLTIYDGGGAKPGGQNVCLAFTVDDVDAEYERLISMGAEIVSPPENRPWGARNLCFLDPDGNRVYLRSFPG